MLYNSELWLNIPNICVALVFAANNSFPYFFTESIVQIPAILQQVKN